VHLCWFREGILGHRVGQKQNSAWWVKIEPWGLRQIIQVQRRLVIREFGPKFWEKWKWALMCTRTHISSWADEFGTW
jgi:hypothetical protein